MTVSMKSGLEGRNNLYLLQHQPGNTTVSMKSGLEGRNNDSTGPVSTFSDVLVSMKSGLEGRNNTRTSHHDSRRRRRLNEVRPRRPEQSRRASRPVQGRLQGVSMKSGLEGRNNHSAHLERLRGHYECLNEVRPRRPEQWASEKAFLTRRKCLNEVRPRRPEQY